MLIFWQTKEKEPVNSLPLPPRCGSPCSPLAATRSTSAWRWSAVAPTGPRTRQQRRGWGRRKGSSPRGGGALSWCRRWCVWRRRLPSRLRRRGAGSPSCPRRRGSFDRANSPTFTPDCRRSQTWLCWTFRAGRPAVWKPRHALLLPRAHITTHLMLCRSIRPWRHGTIEIDFFLHLSELKL